MSIIVEVAGIKWTGIIEVNVISSVENLSGQFSFKTVKDGQWFPFANGDTVRIYADNEQIIDGYIEQIEGERSADAHIITVSGRDKTCDIIDSSLGGNLSFKENISLAEIAQKVLDQLGITNIKIIQEVDIPRFSKGDITSAEIGENAFQFLVKYAKKRQVLMTTDGKGNLVFTRASTTPYLTKLMAGNQDGSNSIRFGNLSANIKKVKVIWDNSKRFYKYVVVCQSNNSAESPDDNSTGEWFKTSDDNIFKIAFDSDVRKTRVNYFNAETSMTPDNAQKNVVWRANVNRGKAFRYVCEAQGFTAQLDKKIWKINSLVTVIDPVWLIDSQLLICSINYNYSLSTGSTVNLELITKDAFKAEYIEDQGQNIKKDKDRVAKEGEWFATDEN